MAIFHSYVKLPEGNPISLTQVWMVMALSSPQCPFHIRIVGEKKRGFNGIVYFTILVKKNHTNIMIVLLKHGFTMVYPLVR